jgi:hypothetical protein
MTMNWNDPTIVLIDEAPEVTVQTPDGKKTKGRTYSPDVVRELMNELVRMGREPGFRLAPALTLLDEGSAAAAGPYYADRWQRWPSQVADLGYLLAGGYQAQHAAPGDPDTLDDRIVQVIADAEATIADARRERRS